MTKDRRLGGTHLSVIDTIHLFQASSNRDEQVGKLLQQHFSNIPLAQLIWELKRHGLNCKAESISIDKQWWTVLNDWNSHLQESWDGPKATTYLLPAHSVETINAICFENCICLFLHAPLPKEKLKSLLTHEYNHCCRLAQFGLPQTVQDYIILEGLAQWAVFELHGEEALDPWAKAFTFKEALDIWDQVDFDSIMDIYAVLFGQETNAIPSHFGYTFGFRLVEQYVKKNLGLTSKQLFTVPTNEFMA